MLHAWLDTWHGIGLIEPGLARQACDLSLTRYRDRWGVSVFVTRKEHSIVQGSGWQATPWGAVHAVAPEPARQLPPERQRVRSPGR